MMPAMTSVAEELPSPDQLGDRPRLEGAPGRPMRCAPVGGLRDRPKTELGEVVLQPGEHSRDRMAGSQAGLDVRADQPRPDGALVVGQIALRLIAAMLGLVRRIRRVE